MSQLKQVKLHMITSKGENEMVYVNISCYLLCRSYSEQMQAMNRFECQLQKERSQHNSNMSNILSKPRVVRKLSNALLIQIMVRNSISPINGYFHHGVIHREKAGG